jgi:Transposase DDE domain
MHTPFFAPWRARLVAFGRQVQALHAHPLPYLEKLFAHLLPAGLLAPTEDGPNSRERIYSLRATFWAFLWQVLNPGAACREVVRQLQALLCLAAAGPIDAGSSAYCQARRRLPLAVLQRARRAASDHAEKLLPPSLCAWRGWRPKVLDGTTVSLPDTPKNQAAYPQLTSQQPGCGFPLLRLVGLFSLGSGALLAYAKGNYHRAELALVYRLRRFLQAGDLLVADRGFASYVLLALLELMGVACLFRLHPARPQDLRRGIRLGPRDRLWIWSRPPRKPRYLPQSLWRRVPAQLTVRVLQVPLACPGFRTQTVRLVTTLSDPEAYPAAELAQLYLRRWRIELWWRHLKTSLGMEVLRCQSPAMGHRELEMYLTAYNFIRGLMAESAVQYDRPLEQISFKGAVDTVRQYSPLIAQAPSRKKQTRLLCQLLETLAGDLVPERPGRREPRAVKRRPKPYPRLTAPRHLFCETSHGGNHRKSR